MTKYQKKGFTLIELSIVVVVIALIVAGVVAGQSLVKQAGLRNVMTELNTFTIAINTFKLQYDAFPGDISNASSFWSTLNDGDSNGSIESSEALYMWDHLGVRGANLLQSSFETADETTRQFGDEPNSKLGDSYYYRAGGTIVASLGYYRDVNDDGIIAGLNEANGPVMSPVQAKQLDDKMDDGYPQTGVMTATDAYPQASHECNTSNSYDLDKTALGCWLTFSLY